MLESSYGASLVSFDFKVMRGGMLQVLAMTR
jgi:hypothetical protein